MGEQKQKSKNKILEPVKQIEIETKDLVVFK